MCTWGVVGCAAWLQMEGGSELCVYVGCGGLCAAWLQIEGVSADRDVHMPKVTASKKDDWQGGSSEEQIGERLALFMSRPRGRYVCPPPLSPRADVAVWNLNARRGAVVAAT